MKSLFLPASFGYLSTQGLSLHSTASGSPPPTPAPLCPPFMGRPIASFPVQITSLQWLRSRQPAQEHASSRLGEQAALPTSHFPASQAAKNRPQLHVWEQMLVAFVMSFAKPRTLSLPSFMRMVDPRGPWNKAFKKFCRGIKLTEAEILAPCSSRVSSLSPTRFWDGPVSPQVLVKKQPQWPACGRQSCNSSTPVVTSTVRGSWLFWGRKIFLVRINHF